MEPVLLIRQEVASKYELRHAEKYFRVEESRVLCRDALVIGRYSVRPLYHELERDLRLLGSRLIHSTEEHDWIASFAYYEPLKEFTPETWTDANIHTCTHPGPFVVKGKLSSRKKHWQTQMFAETRLQALALAERLKEDGEIQEQGVVYRKYVPLKTYEIGARGLPYANEWRFFFLKDRLLSSGYYWSMGDCVAQAELKPAGVELAHRVAEIVARFATFFALDIAETAAGDWILIEINDGQMAAPSENDHDELYGNLQRELARLTLPER